jgi:hypothetical protein
VNENRKKLMFTDENANSDVEKFTVNENQGSRQLATLSNNNNNNNNIKMKRV